MHFRTLVLTVKYHELTYYHYNSTKCMSLNERVILVVAVYLVAIDIFYSSLYFFLLLLKLL